jgi:hypothetical protein
MTSGTRVPVLSVFRRISWPLRFFQNWRFTDLATADQRQNDIFASNLKLVRARTTKFGQTMKLKCCHHPAKIQTFQLDACRVIFN